MNIEELKESIKDKELRLSQLRIMDTNKLRSDDRDLIKDLESEITELKERLGQEWGMESWKWRIENGAKKEETFKGLIK